MDNKVAILSVVYREHEWSETKRCIELIMDVPVFFIERNPIGTGSLSECINRGFNQIISNNCPEYIWVISNVTFSPTLVYELTEYMDAYPDLAAIHPCFHSDHVHMQQTTNEHGSNDFMVHVPFVEFTAPMVRTSIFKNFPLDENMPYWGQDLDWGYRVKQAGHKIGVFHGEQLGHTYIRFKKDQQNKYTKARRKMRIQTDESTRKALFAKYGEAWKDLRWPKTDKEIGGFYHQVMKEKFT